MANKIVVGYDGSDAAKAALDKAIELAKAGDAEITIVCGEDRPPSWIGLTYRGVVSPEMEQYWKEVQDKISAEIEEAAEYVRKAGVKAATACTGDHPVDLMIKVADEVGASWIVVGAQGEGAGHKTVLGSNTMKLLHHTHVPVVVVPG
jgi:nucleotide-binding universal stress UspA family protein